MEVVVNGTSRNVPAGSTITDVLPERGAAASLGVAVALNGTVVRRADWANTDLRMGDKIEILRAVGGG